VVPDVQNGKAPYKSKLVDSFALHMQLVFKLRNADQFQACLDSLGDPASSNYGHFLNATTIQPYLPTPGQKVSVSSYLMKRGFKVTDGTSPIVIDLTAHAGEVSGTLGVKMGLYAEPGKPSFFAPDSDPKLPQNIAALVNGFQGLDNYTIVKPAESPCVGPYCPQGLQVGYSLSGLYSSNYDGTGKNVAIVDAPGDPNMQTAINTYSSEYSLPPVTLDIRYPDGSPTSYDPGWASETAIDVEAVHVIAPGAGIVLLYDTGNLLNSIDYVASNDLASVVSNSWSYSCNSGPCSDTELPSSGVSAVDLRLAVDAAEGLTILFATGDQGAKPDGSSLGTEFPASDPNVLAVGATNLFLTGCGTTTCSGYGSETGASISGGGYSGRFPEPTWQAANIGTKSGRAVPDVSMLGHNPGLWVYSTASNKCGAGGNSAGWFSCAGTSLSTPLWAGFVAILLQMKGSSSYGNIGPLLYQTANSAAYSTLFHDVTSGSNGYYSAGTGWDAVTGWGTPIANKLALALVQLTMTVSYSIQGGGTATSPTFNYVLEGVAKTSALTTTPTGIAVDIGSTWSVTPNPLTGSGGSERWYSNQLLGGSPSTAPIVFTFYHQYLQTLSYSVVGGGTGYTAPTFAANQFGSLSPKTLTGTPTSYWFDSGSGWSATNPLSGSTSTEQWFTTQTTSGTISSTQIPPFAYQHQFMLTTQVRPITAGTVTPSSSWENAASSVPVSETANPGYSFYYWNLDGANVGSNPSFSVSMNSPHTLTAIFRGSSAISISLSSNSITLGTGVTISGTLTPTQSSPGIPAGATIVLSYSLGGGYTPFITTTTASGGGYSVSWIPPYPGSYSLQASWGGDTNYVGSASSVSALAVTGTVTRQPQLLITGPASASRGTTASFTVLITNPTALTLTTTLYVEIIGPNGYYYFDSQQATLSAGASGRFQFDWQVPSTISTGSYVVNVGLIPPTSSSISQTQITIN
jgi:kumamolisin